MGRDMIVGGEHMVGSTRHHDYDELMEMGADAPSQPAHHPAHHAHPGHHPGYHPNHHHDPHPGHRDSMPRRKHLVSEEPTHERQFPIGFTRDAIPPGQEVDVVAEPQVYFRGERLAIPPRIARHFDILDIKVGKDSQLAAAGAMPGESFNTNAVGVRMELDTAKAGILLILRVRNNDTIAHDFKAVMYGAVLE